MQHKDPEIYAAILEADRLSQQNFSGHGSAIAQVYNHMIMPLANTRDKRTQIIWGIKDFESRFKRKPEGMWLAETAVDLESLDMMAEQGIKFTVLAPHQAKRVKQGGQESSGMMCLWPRLIRACLTVVICRRAGKSVFSFMTGRLPWGLLLKDCLIMANNLPGG